MKLTAIISLLALTLLGATGTTLAQQENQYPAQEKQAKPAPRPTPAGEPAFGRDKKKCPCEIVGTWKAQLSKTEARLYEFDTEGVVKVLTISADAKPRQIATAKYEFVEEPLPMEESAAPAQKTPDKELLEDLQSFVQRDFSDFIVVAVGFDSTDGRFSGPALQAFASANLGTLKNKTYLERKDGKRVFLMQYQAPINDGLGAKFIFPRIVDEKKFLTAESGSFRFYSEVNGQLKLNIAFKLSDMMYNGRLEY